MRISLLFVSLLAIVPNAVLASVLAIDYGADFIKASLMKPGIPFDVLLNKDSKRKIHSSVAWKRGDRLFGQDAAYLATRFPSDTFSHLKYLQAAPHDSESAAYFSKISPATVSQNDRFLTNLTRSDGTEWCTEELVAMQFAYIKHLAELVANEKVRDVIITVPGYYTQFERDAVADAVEVAGLRLLALINDGTAVAVNYAMTRAFPTPETHVIYDVGSSGIRATVVEFSTTTDKKTLATGTQINVLGFGSDRTVGGIEFDRRVREILADAFNAKQKGKDVRKDKRGMAKLWKEAQRVKGILSANQDAVAHVESLAWDIDFKTKISRAAFEQACADLEPKFTQPLYDALRFAGLDLTNITSVIMAGGASRTPMVQTAIKAAVPADKLSFNVNADEAAVLGAALHGASLSRQFKTKNIKVSDILTHDVQATYFAAATTPLGRPRSITTTLFPAGSKVGTKKTMTFKRKDDFVINFDYKKEPLTGFPTRMFEVDINGVVEALQNLTDSGAVDPVVKATVSLSESGFIAVNQAIAYGEIKDDSLTGKFKGLFGGSSTPESDESTEDIPPRPTASSESSQSTSSSDAAAHSESADAKKEKKEEKKKVTGPVEIELPIYTRWTTIPPLTVEQKKAARDRLRAVDAEELAKSRREEARNNFESYLYRLRDLLSDESEDKPFIKCSQPGERQKLQELLEESFSWLNDRGDLAETSQLLDKRIALETLEKPVIHRYQEIEAFPQALNNSQMWNWNTRLFLAEARENLTAEAKADLPSKWTADELDNLEKALKDHESWLDEWVEKQKKVKANQDPVIETREMKARAKVLEQHLHRLYRRKVPKAVKKKTTTTTEPTSTASTEESTETEVPPADDEKQVPLDDERKPKPHDEL